MGLTGLRAWGSRCRLMRASRRVPGAWGGSGGASFPDPRNHVTRWGTRRRFGLDHRRGAGVAGDQFACLLDEGLGLPDEVEEVGAVALLVLALAFVGELEDGVEGGRALVGGVAEDHAVLG